ncbi:MAG: Tol-Pal system protein TolB, partial [Gammaproteobacteria bacterium]|nr:Tol-Pal system protein TolB [Gammaproteobacteria bacterium]
MRILIVLLTGLLTLAAMPSAQAELRIEISRGAERPMPVAIVPFGWQGNGQAAFDVASLVARDLASTGRFQPLAPTEMPQRPTAAADVDLPDWKMVGVEAVAVGELLQTGPDDFTIQFQLLDVLRGTQLLGYKLPSSRAGLRLSSHRVADMVY